MAKMAQEKPKTEVDQSQLMQTLQSMQEEINRLKEEKENPHAQAKKRYEWPRHYSYKMWWGVPVLSYKTVKKDESRDLTYKNQHWVMVNNHYLQLELAKWDPVTVDVNDFNTGFTRSEKLPCEVKSDWSNVTGYTFKTKQFWEFTVLPQMIN